MLRALPHLLGSAAVLLALATPLPQSLVAEHMFVKAMVLEVYLFGLLAAYMAGLRGMRLRYTPAPLALAVIALGAWAVASSFWSAAPGHSVVQLLKWAAAGSSAVLALQIGERKQVDTLLAYVFVGAVLTAAIGVCQHLFGLDYYQQERPPASTYGNRNLAAHVIVVSWPLGVYLMASTNSPLRRGLLAAGVAVCLAYLFYTGARTAWLAIGVQMGFLAPILLARRDARRAVASLPAVLLLVVLVNVDGEGFRPVTTVLEATVDETAGDLQSRHGDASYIRFTQWREAAAVLRAHPYVGVGIGAYGEVHPAYASEASYRSTAVHNDYLQLTAELGMTGLLLVVVAFAMFVRDGVRRRHADMWHREDPFLLAAIAGVVVTATLSFPLQLIGPLVLAGLLLGLWLRGSAVRSIQPGLTARSAAFAVAWVLLVVAATANWHWWRKLGDLEARIEDGWRTALDFASPIRHPMFTWIVQELALRYQATDDPAGQVLAASYLPHRPDDAVLHSVLAYFAVRSRDIRAAERHIELARRHEPADSFRGLEVALLLHLETGSRDGLRSTLAELDAKPRDALTRYPRMLSNMAVAALAIGDPERARRYLRENLTRHPRDGRTLAQLDGLDADP